jgi:hypothetical protein
LNGLFFSMGGGGGSEPSHVIFWNLPFITGACHLLEVSSEVLDKCNTCDKQSCVSHCCHSIILESIKWLLIV